MEKMPSSDKVYFDCNATTHVLPAAALAANKAMTSVFGNPSSAHLEGIKARDVLDTTRKLAAEVVGAEDSKQIIFTSGATEAIQLAVLSALKHASSSMKTKVLFGSTEHKAVSESVRHWINILGLPFKIVELPVGVDGQIVLSELEKHVQDAAFICTMAINNETGTIQDLKAIEEVLIRHRSSALWLVDGVQALGKIDLDLKKTRIDYMAVSGHKLYALKGVGFLYVSKNAPYTPIMVGGGQERNLRSGTENVPGIASFEVVLNELKTRTHFVSIKQLHHYRISLVKALKESFPGIVFNTPLDNSVPTTLNFSVPDMSNSEMMRLFDSVGIQVSAGSACSSGASKSHVLTAMGLENWRCESAVRLSFGPGTLPAEIQRGVEKIKQIGNGLFLGTIVPEVTHGVTQMQMGPSNTWIVTDKTAKTCIVIDPCESMVNRIDNYVRLNELNLIAVVDTHVHGDHESVRPELTSRLKDFFANKRPGDQDHLGWPSHSPYMTEVVLENNVKVPALKLNQNGSVFARVSTPGHTKDSVMFLYGEIDQNQKLSKSSIHYAFCGDTILAGGLGRTDFPVSDTGMLYLSLKDIATILDHEQTVLCPGHDYNASVGTSLHIEKENSAFLKDTLNSLPIAQFVSTKKEIDKKLTIGSEFQTVVCGVTMNNLGPCDLSVNPDYIKNDPNALIVDMREDYEKTGELDWKFLGAVKSTRHVPLSRSISFISEMVRTSDKNSKILFVCNSGARSLSLARSMRRFGFNNVKSLQGGFSLHS